jgi:GntR family transcriptional regulator
MADSAVLTQAIDPASDRAVYKQIADHLRAAMGRGSLREGEQLPSEAQLMEHYGVARMTIRNALRVLQDEGLVTAEHGRGVYVRARPPVRRLASDRFAQRHRKEGMAAFTVEAAQIGATPKVDTLTVTQAQPPAEIADRLGLADSGRPREGYADRRSQSRPRWHLCAPGGARPYPGPVHRGRVGPDADA